MAAMARFTCALLMPAADYAAYADITLLAAFASAIATEPLRCAMRPYAADVADVDFAIFCRRRRHYARPCRCVGC